MQKINIVSISFIFACMLYASIAQAGVWIVDYSQFENTGANALIGIEPPVPDEYFPIAATPGSLTQGTGPWGPTALYQHGPDGSNSRFFHSLNLGNNFNVDTGVAFSWRIRYGALTPGGRNGVQLSVEGDSGNGSSPYVSVAHTEEGSILYFIDNVPQQFATYGEDDNDPRRVLPMNIGNQVNQWLQFSAAAINPFAGHDDLDEIDGRSDWIYWKLWLTTEDSVYDRKLLLFSGGGGSPVHPETGEQFSFRSWQGNGRRFRLAQADLSTAWDMEYDYISWTDEGAILINENGAVQLLEVPDFIQDGLQYQMIVEEAIIEAGFKVGKVTGQYSSSILEGIVISQDPPAGTDAYEGSAIDITVSLGEAPSNLPISKNVFFILIIGFIVVSFRANKIRSCMR